MDKKEAFEALRKLEEETAREIIAEIGIEAYEAQDHWINNPLIKPLNKVHILNEWMARAWDEGFNAGELDLMQHEENGWDEDCIPNPYRKES